MKTLRICKSEFEYKVRNILSYVVAGIIVLGIFALASALCFAIFTGICLIGNAIPTFGILVLSIICGLSATITFVLKQSNLI